MHCRYGGKALALSPDFAKFAVTKAEYSEKGHELCKERFATFCNTKMVSMHAAATPLCACHTHTPPPPPPLVLLMFVQFVLPHPLPINPPSLTCIFFSPSHAALFVSPVLWFYGSMVRFPACSMVHDG